jgi:hypothetical protein
VSGSVPQIGGYRRRSRSNAASRLRFGCGGVWGYLRASVSSTTETSEKAKHPMRRDVLLARLGPASSFLVQLLDPGPARTLFAVRTWDGRWDSPSRRTDFSDMGLSPARRGRQSRPGVASAWEQRPIMSSTPGVGKGALRQPAISAGKVNRRHDLTELSTFCSASR